MGNTRRANPTTTRKGVSGLRINIVKHDEGKFTLAVIGNLPGEGPSIVTKNLTIETMAPAVDESIRHVRRQDILEREAQATASG